MDDDNMMMVYDGNSYAFNFLKLDDLGVPPFMDTISTKPSPGGVCS